MGWGLWEASGTYPAKPDPSTPRIYTTIYYFYEIKLFQTRADFVFDVDKENFQTISQFFQFKTFQYRLQLNISIL